MYEKDKYECLGKHGMLPEKLQIQYDEEQKQKEIAANENMKEEANWLFGNYNLWNMILSQYIHIKAPF